jgi:predicted secreted protein
MDIPTRIDLKVGETYVLRLKGLGSAGYTWDYSIDGNDKVVTVSRETASNPTTARAGGPPPDTYSLDHLFKIQAHEPGRVLIHFFQHRTWEKGKPPLEEHVLEVHSEI